MIKKCICISVSCVALALALLANITYADIDNEKDEVRVAVDDFVDEVYPNLSCTEKKYIADSLYEERINGSGLGLDFIEPVPYVQEEDPAYIMMMERENYVVDLINDMGGVATFESWEYNLNFLLEHYDNIIGQDDVNMIYVDRYIEDYNALIGEEDMPDEKVYTGTTLAF